MRGSRGEKRLSALAWLIKRVGIDPGELADESGLDARIRVQKLVFLMRELVREFRTYRFNLYKFGPYSKDLADDYYKLASLSREELDRLSGEYSPSPRAERLLEELSRFDTETLELMATAVDLWVEMRRHFKDVSRSRMVRRLLAVKGWATIRDAERAVRKAEELGLLRLVDG